jgi:hypothetical protein
MGDEVGGFDKSLSGLLILSLFLLFAGLRILGGPNAAPHSNGGNCLQINPCRDGQIDSETRTTNNSPINNVRRHDQHIR